MRLEKLARLIRKAPHVYIVGNGGSYANAIHICNDLLACAVPAATIDPSTLTAIANDYGYYNVFDRWLRTVGKRDDLLICLSGSGQSPNIIRAIRSAKVRYMTTLLVTGAYEPDPKAAHGAHHVIRRGRNMQAAEEYQIALGHSLLKALKK